MFPFSHFNFLLSLSLLLLVKANWITFSLTCFTVVFFTSTSLASTSSYWEILQCLYNSWKCQEKREEYLLLGLLYQHMPSLLVSSQISQALTGPPFKIHLINLSKYITFFVVSSSHSSISFQFLMMHDFKVLTPCHVSDKKVCLSRCYKVGWCNKIDGLCLCTSKLSFLLLNSTWNKQL